MYRFLRLSMFAAMAAGMAHASLVTVDLAASKGSVCVGSCGTPTTITGTGTSTFVNALFSSTMGTATPPTASSTAQEFTNNSGVSTVPFVVDQNSSSQSEYFSGNTTNTTTTLVIDMGGYSGGAATTGIANVLSLYTMLQGTLAAPGWQGIDVTLTGINSVGTAISDTFLLTSGTDYRSTNSGVSGQAICTNANIGCTSLNAANVPASPGSESQTIAAGTTGTVLIYVPC
jgi:hypothetical protein